jgi:hypothetical protein
MQPSAPLSTKKHARDRGVWVGEGAVLEAMMNEDQFRKRKIGSIPVDQVGPILSPLNTNSSRF